MHSHVYMDHAQLCYQGWHYFTWSLETVCFAPVSLAFHLRICCHPGKRKASSMSHPLRPASRPLHPSLLLSSMTTCMQKSERLTDSLKSLLLSSMVLLLLLVITTMLWYPKKAWLCLVAQQLRKLMTSHSLLSSMPTYLGRLVQPHKVDHLILCPKLTRRLHHQDHLPSAVSLTYISNTCA